MPTQSKAPAKAQAIIKQLSGYLGDAARKAAKRNEQLKKTAKELEK